MKDEVLRRQLLRMIDELKIKGVPEIPPGALVVCTRTKDWDTANNDPWEDPRNKSYPRPDVHCTKCGEELVMSNFVYGELRAGKSFSSWCLNCIVEAADKEAP